MTYDLVAILQIMAAFTALIAAFFWFRSASAKAPPITESWQGIIDLENWLNRVGKRNRWAAGFTGVSALLAAASAFVDVP